MQEPLGYKGLQAYRKNAIEICGKGHSRKT